MYYIYTFIIFVLYLTQILNCETFLLDLAKTGNYSNGNIKVAVQKIENLYNHKFEKPVFLKEVYNGNDKLYFESLLTNVQTVHSASVLWDYNKPIVVQLNLEKSSVVLLNDDSFLTVQAIFSMKGVTNITPKKHLTTDLGVSVNLSEFEDYEVKTGYKLPVTQFSFSNSRLKDYNLVYYNLESERLEDIKYNNNKLTTSDQTKTTKPDSSKVTEVPLEIPSKEEVYGVYAYFYDRFPLMIEIVYTFSKRIFYGNTPNKKWHRIFLPSIEDPSYVDYLADLLDYYACVNKYNYTVNISKIPAQEGTSETYTIENYCVSPHGVEKIDNELSVDYLYDSFNIGYKGYNHKSKDDRNFLLKYLILDEEILQFPEIPSITKFVQVFHKDDKPVAVGFFTPKNEVVAYKLVDGQWEKHMTIVKVFNESYRFIVDESPIDLLPLTEKVSIVTSTEHTMRSIKYDRQLNLAKSYSLTNFDLWYYNSYQSSVMFEGTYDNYTVTIKDYCGIDHIYYYESRVIDFREYATKVFVNIVKYFYDYKTDDMYVELYTNILYTYKFKLNYYDENPGNWEQLYMKPVEMAGTTRSKTTESENLRIYFEKTKDFDFKNKVLPDETAKLMPDNAKIKISKVDEQVINTISRNNQLKTINKLIDGEFDVWYYNSYSYYDYVTYEGDLYAWMVIKTKRNVGLSIIKYYTYDLVDFRNKGIHVHRLEYFYNPNTYFMTVYLYTDTLYVYCYTISYYDYSYIWKLVSKEPANITDPENPEKLQLYFEKTKKVEDFTKKLT